MEIIEIPHPTLRKKAKKVEGVDKKLVQFVDELQNTLAATTNPKGAGLAAPQVDKLWRIFATQVDEPMAFINPIITKHAPDTTLGPDEDDPIMEGCLSMPNLYGPVPRWEWIQVEYDQLKDNKLIRTEQHFEDFPARVIQHEIDHLNGILFTDYALKYDLPVYQQVDKEKYQEVDTEFLEMI